MQHLLQQQSVSVTKTVIQASEPYVLSGDFILPEYCPDVAVVLKCLVTPQVHTRHYAGDTLMLDGTVVVRVLYFDEERRCVRTAEFTQPMSAALRGEAGCEGTPAWVWVTQDYVNCRAVSPRRMEVRGGLVLHAVGYAACSLELPAASSDAHLYTKTQRKTVTSPLCVSEKSVLVNETLSFDGALPPAEQLLSVDCTAVVNECKLLNSKAIVKGQVYVHSLYTDDSVNGSTHVFEDAVPYSLIMDADGVYDGCLHTVRVDVLSDTEECVAGANGVNTALDFSAKLLVQLCAFEKAETTWLLDAYHRDYPVMPTTQSVEVRSLCEAFRQTSTVQKSIALPADGLREIVDLWVTPQTVSGQMTDTPAELTAPMLVSMLVRDTDGCLAYYERAEEVRVDCAQAAMCPPCEVQADVAVVNVGYAVMGDKLDLRLTVCASVMLWEMVRETVLSEVALQQEEPYTKEPVAVRLYYAAAGERVWDIARHCHVSPQTICDENELTEDTLSMKKVLLIPAE